MGNCLYCKTKNKKQNLIIPDDVLCKYPRTGSVKIRFKNYIGKITNEQIVDFTVTEPTSLTTNIIPVGLGKIFLSLCILPGMDTRNPGSKVCQDGAFFLSDSRSLFIVLFDGHGNEGEKVVEFCKQIVENLYKTQKDLQIKNPLEFFELITETCDKELEKKSSGINAMYSGCTGVFSYITEDVIYSGSVGDSRAVLGTTELPDILPVPNSILADKQILQDIRDRRNSNPSTKIWPLQLTKDQKPQDLDEKKRIEQSGGRVQRLLDEFGKRIGPYRVWDKSGNYPGLAMSRSLGDLAAKRIGVTSKPVCTTHTINKESDLFLIIASDGLWDAMDNEDVVNFIECFRRKSSSNIIPLKNSEVNLSNSCISHLLAEEARLRWFSIVEEEDVSIDDITCIVIEIQASGGTLVQHTKRPRPEELSLPLDSIQEIEFKRAPSIKEVTIRDPKRSSVVSENVQWIVERTTDNLMIE
ncbi:hypothetical protein SteCoe_26823 [Stentor coeruleus]|uniref:PPM-type phosphatase domain-containing protein n=1 Tax=Stentor coeruleus TaxID=5963 RepID=A0A1R2BBZ5_9CILI|nr:hypothetical protein SteCoe_26823 [Stentor coeruleus]